MPYLVWGQDNWGQKLWASGLISLSANCGADVQIESQASLVFPIQGSCDSSTDLTGPAFLLANLTGNLTSTSELTGIIIGFDFIGSDMSMVCVFYENPSSQVTWNILANCQSDVVCVDDIVQVEYLNNTCFMVFDQTVYAELGGDFYIRSNTTTEVTLETILGGNYRILSNTTAAQEAEGALNSEQQVESGLDVRADLNGLANCHFQIRGNATSNQELRGLAFRNTPFALVRLQEQFSLEGTPIRIVSILSDIEAFVEEWIKGRRITKPMQIDYFQIKQAAMDAILGRLKSSDLTGTVDGVNTVFTLPENYLSVLVAFDQGNSVGFTETGPDEITFTTAPTTGTPRALYIQE